jgi:hypothetical protein
VTRGRTVRPDRAREKFLDVLAETCNVSESARQAGIGRRTAYEWRAADALFAEAWNEAEQEAADKLEREAWRRAVEGTDKPVTYQGVITGTYKEYSDKMLEILLRLTGLRNLSSACAPSTPARTAAQSQSNR